MNIQFSNLVLTCLFEAGTGTPAPSSTATPTASSTAVPGTSATAQGYTSPEGGYSVKNIRVLGDSGNEAAKKLYAALYQMAATTQGHKTPDKEKIMGSLANVASAASKMNFAG